ncbi:hypothetical protein NVP1081O_160 [Vibrio phage 1.081.O._10N.286.52.C2]|nr:hypothetical protein NVP1081O_160 [Vibrio phage 1.081.O._10N.286.52.C2]
MKVLFQSLFGSKLYGCDTPESDTDYKTIYQPELCLLLRGRDIKNSVVSTGNSKGKNTVDDEDQEFIPVQVFMRDFLGGQSYAIELAFNALSNPNDCNDTFLQLCQELTSNYLTSNVKSMVGYAINQAQKYGIKGTRLNSLIEFKTLVDEHAGDMNQKLKDNTALCQKLHELVETDQHVEFLHYHGPLTTDPAHLLDPAFSVLGKVFGLEIDFTEATKRLDNMVGKYGSRAKQARVSSGNDWKAISHAVRVIDQAIDILDRQELVFPLRNAEFYRDIKLGKYEWEYISEVLSARMRVLEASQLTSTLPVHSPELVADFYEWHDRKLAIMYAPVDTLQEYFDAKEEDEFNY